MQVDSLPAEPQGRSALYLPAGPQGVSVLHLPAELQGGSALYQLSHKGEVLFTQILGGPQWVAGPVTCPVGLPLSNCGNGSLSSGPSRVQSSLSGSPGTQEGPGRWTQIPEYPQGSELVLCLRLHLLTSLRSWVSGKLLPTVRKKTCL